MPDDNGFSTVPRTPWHVDGDSVRVKTITHALQVAECYNAETARRIAACVNACEGIPIEVLEVGSVDGGSVVAACAFDAKRRGAWEWVRAFYGE